MLKLTEHEISTALSDAPLFTLDYTAEQLAQMSDEQFALVAIALSSFYPSYFYMRDIDSSKLSKADRETFDATIEDMRIVADLFLTELNKRKEQLGLY